MRRSFDESRSKVRPSWTLFWIRCSLFCSTFSSFVLCCFFFSRSAAAFCWFDNLLMFVWFGNPSFVFRFLRHSSLFLLIVLAHSDTNRFSLFICLFASWFCLRCVALSVSLNLSGKEAELREKSAS